MKNIINFLLILTSVLYSSLCCSQMQVQVRVFLSGALNNFNGQYSTTGTPLMTDKLRVNSFNGQRNIPDNDPYFYPMQHFDVSQHFIHIEAMPNQSLHQISNPTLVFGVTGDNAIVDWIYVQLRSMTDSTLVLATRSGLLQRDGDVVDLDGVSLLQFNNVLLEKYYVVVKHRSHLGVMSKIVNAGDFVDFTNVNTITYDFGTSIPGLDLSGTSQIKFWAGDVAYNCLFAGDANKDGKAKFEGVNNDLSIIHSDVLSHPNNTNFAAHFDKAIGYYNSDVNMDSKAKFDNPNDDKNILYSYVLTHPLNQNFNANFDWIIEQIPQDN